MKMPDWKSVFLDCSNVAVRFYDKIVKELKDCGQSDTWIMKHLGMDPEELLRLKQVSGLASLFAEHEFSESEEE